ncbi:MAG: TIGR02996 domain-containing protein [Gemmataceae bacterium]|nr:TIGR02996 domain-containing protein [Gemmataceae bacterium]
MSSHAEFISAIRANPDDDTARLAFADFLAENGEDERGEFVRTQIARARLAPDDPQHSALHARELRLLAKHGVTWTAGPPLLRRARFRGGFAEVLNGPTELVIEQLPESVTVAPIRELQVSGMGAADGLGARLAERPELENIDSIAVDDMGAETYAPAEQIEALFASKHLKRLRRLKLFCGACTAEVLDTILSLPAMRSLETIHINGGLDTDDAIGVLVKHPDIVVREFRAHKGPHGTWAMGLGGLRALVESGLWRDLEVLNVGVRPDPEIMYRIGEFLPESRLHTLWLHNGSPEPSEDGFFMYSAGQEYYGVEQLARAGSWGNLRDLRFEYIPLNQGHLTILLATEHIRQLTRLSIFGGMLGPEQGAEILRCQRLSGLRTLELSCNFMLGPKLGDHLAEATHLTNLVDLRLNWVQGTDSVAEAVASCAPLANVRNLELANNFITAAGMAKLGAAPHLGNVNRLRVFEHPYGPWQRLLDRTDPKTFCMTAEASAALASGLPNLGCLEIYGYTFPADSFAPLLAAVEKMWVAADPRHITAITARAAFAARTNELWMPPLAEYLEEEEPHP